jgi:hypothetical protein
MENHARYGEMAYSHDGKALSVNLFMASELQWGERGFALRQETRFPDKPRTTLVITAAPTDTVTVRIRHPFWLAAETLAVRVNGQPVEAASKPGGFAEVSRVWKPGDHVQIELPMKLRVARQSQCPGWVSVFYGPILLAGELGGEGLSQADFIGMYTPVKALVPLSRAPVMVASTDDQIVSGIAPVPGRPCVFRTAGLVKPADVNLAPFFRVHFQRYAVYWKLTEQAQWEVQQRKIEEEARAERELAARTVDRVRTGEQQPEIDHNLRFERSTSGSGPQGRRWREARDGGWFSYDMKLPPAGTKAAVLVTYWGKDGGREFDIQIDGKVIASPKVEGGKDDYYSVEYPIAEAAIAGKDKATVRFQTKPGKVAGGVFDLRIVTVK